MLIDFEDKDLETTVQKDNVCFVTFSAMMVQTLRKFTSCDAKAIR